MKRKRMKDKACGGDGKAYGGDGMACDEHNGAWESGREWVWEWA